MHLTIEDARENLDAMVDITKRRKVPMVADLSKIASATREVREYYASDAAAAVVTAVAIVVGNPVTRIIGSFFLRINRPPYPTAMFTSVDKAVDWARDFVPA